MVSIGIRMVLAQRAFDRNPASSSLCFLSFWICGLIAQHCNGMSIPYEPRVPQHRPPVPESIERQGLTPVGPSHSFDLGGGYKKCNHFHLDSDCVCSWLSGSIPGGTRTFCSPKLPWLRIGFIKSCVLSTF